MKSFLLKPDKTPLIRFGNLPDNTFFEGKIPTGMYLAVAPSENIVILDVDVKNNKNGFQNIPDSIQIELFNTFNYQTSSGGAHFFINYTGNKILMNRATKYGLDLRIGAKNGNNGGFVRYQWHEDIRDCMHLIKDSSKQLNLWLEKLFT